MIQGEYWRVEAAAQQLYWARCNSERAVPLQEGSCAGSADLPLPAGAKVVLYVPGERVRVHSVPFPPRNQRRFLEALPFALEERLLRDPDGYHFVPLRGARGQAEMAVAVIESEHMDHWLAEAAARNWCLHALIPDYLGIAAPEDGVWFLEASMTPFLLRQPRGQGGAALPGVPGPRPPGALLLALERTRRPPQCIRVRVADDEQRGHVKRWLDGLAPHEVELEIVKDDLPRSAWLARQPLPDKRLNLLAGRFLPEPQSRVRARRLAPSAVLAAALMLTVAIHWFVDGVRIRAQHETLQQAIESTYRRAFPDARNLVDPRYQMEQRLLALRRDDRQGRGNPDLLSGLEGLAPMLAEGDRYIVETLSYDSSGITLELSAPDYESLQRLQDRLAQHAATVEVEHAELRGGQVYGRFRLRGRT